MAHTLKHKPMSHTTKHKKIQHEEVNSLTAGVQRGGARGRLNTVQAYTVAGVQRGVGKWPPQYRTHKFTHVRGAEAR